MLPSLAAPPPSLSPRSSPSMGGASSGSRIEQRGPPSSSSPSTKNASSSEICLVTSSPPPAAPLTSSSSSLSCSSRASLMLVELASTFSIDCLREPMVGDEPVPTSAVEIRDPAPAMVDPAPDMIAIDFLPNCLVERWKERTFLKLFDVIFSFSLLVTLAYQIVEAPFGGMVSLVVHRIRPTCTMTHRFAQASCPRRLLYR
mmetsp:Transcript_19374/g.50849  ORF Transcript_19374/g.50849 Transcript_19374/m.50849 type:complete len:201 (+) Transcript_19374:1488-2090(+)